MNMHPHDPLSPEERALAERLRRLGGANGPSPALDARILAAAREAAAPRPTPTRQRRWLAWSTVPGGAITAVGTAAAFVLVVGLVWQLRPGERPVPAGEASDADDGFVSVQMIERPAPPAATADAAPALAPAQETSEDTARMASPARAPKLAPSAAAGSTAAPVAAAPQATSPVPSPAPPPAPSAAPSERSMATGTAAAPAGVIERIETPEPTPEASAAPARRRATYTTSARARPEAGSSAARALRAGTADTAMRDHVDFGPPATDAELAPADWLQRIRDRRDNGDTEGAAESLRRFREVHPRVPVPDDLRTPVE